MQRLLSYSSTERRNGRMARGKESHFMYFLTANILTITQLIQLEPSPSESESQLYIYIVKFIKIYEQKLLQNRTADKRI